MDRKDLKFIADVYHLIKKIESLVEENDIGHRVMAAIFVGVMDEQQLQDLADEDSEFGNVNMQSMYSFNIDSKQELEIIKGLMDEAYDNEGPDLNGLLGGLGISLN